MEPGRIYRKRILLVDDQQGVREAIRFLLLVDEHTVREASHGKEALEWFQREPFDLVITDYSMPGMTGNELAARIRVSAPHQPVLMITAYSEELALENNPVDAILSKPFSFHELRQTISRLLGPACVV